MARWEDDERISIWSVPARQLPLYYGSFAALTGFSAVVSVVTAARATTGWVELVVEAAATLAPLAVASAAVIITVMEVAGMMGVVADAIRRRQREQREREIAEAEERGRYEEREEREREIDYWQVVELFDVPGIEYSKAEKIIATDPSRELCERAARKRLRLAPDDPWPEGVRLEAVLLPRDATRKEAVAKAMQQFERVGCEKCGSKRPSKRGGIDLEEQTGGDVYVICPNCDHKNMMSSRDLD
jgi:DNA-directed RNA polymerase subunit RPC12/RpoP